VKDFVHLHLHTEFSLLDGACRIDELLDEAERLKMPALAVTEHGNMFSSVVFHDAARKRGINPILGCEVYVAPGDRRDKSGTPGETANHLVLLAENEVGFKNLIKLVSSGYTEGFYYKPRIDKEILAQHAEGLIGLSSCLKGEVATRIRTEQMPRALAAAAQYRDILGKGNFFLEMQFQGIEEQRIVNNGLLPIARDLEMPLVVTNDVHYLRHGDHKPHDILLCIGTGKSVNDENRLKYHGDQFFLKTAAQMAEVFGDYPDAMKNTLLIAERCNVTIPSGQNHLPKFAVPEGFTLDQYFEHVTREGYKQRLERLRQLDEKGELRHTLAEYDERLAYEIAMIKKMEYPGYFMIVWDFIRYARDHGIPVGPGRGSAAGSLVAWALRITDVDPLHYDLIFERFLNPERVSLPDIDVDFCERRRGEVIAYVTEKYGRENVSQIITFGTMKAKAVIRDVGRVMDMPYADVDRIAKQIPPALDMTLEKALAENPVLRDMARADGRVNDVLEMGKRLEGVSRNAGVHAAGRVTPLTPRQKHRSPRQRKHHHQRGTNQRDRKCGLQRQAEPTEIDAEGGLTHTEAVDRDRCHLHDERQRHQNRQVRQRNRHVQRVGNRPVERHKHRLHYNRTDQAQSKGTRGLTKLREGPNQPGDPFLHPFLVQSLQRMQQTPDPFRPEQHGHRKSHTSPTRRPQQYCAPWPQRVRRTSRQGRPQGRHKHQAQQADPTVHKHDRGREGL